MRMTPPPLLVIQFELKGDLTNLLLISAAGSPVTEIVGSPVTVGSLIVVFGASVAAVGSPIAVGSLVTFSPPVIEIGICNVLLFYVAPDIWRNFYVKLVLYCMYGT